MTDDSFDLYFLFLNCSALTCDITRVQCELGCKQSKTYLKKKRTEGQDNLPTSLRLLSKSFKS